jgi:hypothetical protein
VPYTRNGIRAQSVAEGMSIRERRHCARSQLGDVSRREVQGHDGGTGGIALLVVAAVVACTRAC